jgi:hypothetical protein
MSGFFTNTEEAVELESPPLRIHSLPGAIPPPRAAATPAAVTHRFGSPALNGRLGEPLPDGDWKVRWEADLEPGLNTAAVLSGWDRLLVWGWLGWQLFDAAGKAVASGPLDSADVLLDDQEPLIFLVDGAGKFSARRADSGAQAYLLEAPSRRLFQVSFLARYRQHLVAGSASRPPQPHAAVMPHTCVVQAHRLDGERAAVERELTRDVAQVLMAMHQDTLAIATGNRIYLAGANLNIRAAIEGEFEPLAMSLDEAGRIYLIVRDHQGQALWVVTPEGGRVVSYRLPAGARAGTVPPLVAYDHQVYILASGRLLAIGPSGKLLWEQAVSEAAAGSVSADGALLLANGADLVRFTASGERRTLHQFGEWLRAPAIVTAAGELIAATGNRLYCLARSGK